MNVLDGLKVYADQYDVENVRPFNEGELSQIASAKIVPSQYGMSVCFYLKGGGQKYIPVSRDSICQVGDIVDLSKAKVLSLIRGGSNRITRIEV